MRRHPYVWLAYREMDGFWRILVSNDAVPGWEQAANRAQLQKADGTSYHEWEIKAVIVDRRLVSGHADLDERFLHHIVDTTGSYA